jgi:hypothetical protein
LLARHVLESVAVDAADSPIQPAQQLKAWLGDRRGDHPAVARIANALHQATFGQPIQQTREVRIARQHALRDRPTGERVRPCATQDSQHVVLRKRQVRDSQHLDLTSQQVIRRQHQGLEHPLFEAQFRTASSNRVRCVGHRI